MPGVVGGAGCHLCSDLPVLLERRRGHGRHRGGGGDGGGGRGAAFLARRSGSRSVTILDTILAGRRTARAATAAARL